MKIAQGYISVRYQEVEYMLIRDISKVSKEDLEAFLNPQSPSKIALVNQNTWSHIESLIEPTLSSGEYKEVKRVEKDK